MCQVRRLLVAEVVASQWPVVDTATGIPSFLVAGVVVRCRRSLATAAFQLGTLQICVSYEGTPDARQNGDVSQI